MSVYVIALSFIVANYNKGSAAYSFGGALFTVQSVGNALGYDPASRIMECPPDLSAAATYTYKAVFARFAVVAGTVVAAVEVAANVAFSSFACAFSAVDLAPLVTEVFTSSPNSVVSLSLQMHAIRSYP